MWDHWWRKWRETGYRFRRVFRYSPLTAVVASGTGAGASCLITIAHRAALAVILFPKSRSDPLFTTTIPSFPSTLLGYTRIPEAVVAVSCLLLALYVADERHSGSILHVAVLGNILLSFVPSKHQKITRDSIVVQFWTMFRSLHAAISCLAAAPHRPLSAALAIISRWRTAQPSLYIARAGVSALLPPLIRCDLLRLPLAEPSGAPPAPAAVGLAATALVLCFIEWALDVAKLLADAASTGAVVAAFTARLHGLVRPLTFAALPTGGSPCLSAACQVPPQGTATSRAEPCVADSLPHPVSVVALPPDAAVAAERLRDAVLSSTRSARQRRSCDDGGGGSSDTRCHTPLHYRRSARALVACMDAALLAVHTVAGGGRGRGGGVVRYVCGCDVLDVAHPSVAVAWGADAAAMRGPDVHHNGQAVTSPATTSVPAQRAVSVSQHHTQRWDNDGSLIAAVLDVMDADTAALVASVDAAVEAGPDGASPGNTVR